MSPKKSVIPLPAIGETVVVMGVVDHVDEDGLIFVKLQDRTISGAGQYVARLAFWPGAVFPLKDSGISASRGFAQAKPVKS